MKTPIPEIIDLTAEAFAIDRDAITGHRTTQRCVLPRFAVYVVASAAGHTRHEIGAALGRDHSTVTQGIAKADVRAGTDGAFAVRLARLLSACSGPARFVRGVGA